MQLGISYDTEYFNVQFNGSCVPAGTSVRVKYGDIIRITTTYERNWFVNKAPIGLFDVVDDAMYQNVYTMIVTDDLSPFGELCVTVPKGTSDAELLPYSVLDAYIACPDNWHFFKAMSAPSRIDVGFHREHERIFGLGCFVSSLGLDDYRFKILDSEYQYHGHLGYCGVIKKGDEYLWLHQGKIENDAQKAEAFEKASFSSFAELSDYVTLKLLKEASK